MTVALSVRARRVVLGCRAHVIRLCRTGEDVLLESVHGNKQRHHQGRYEQSEQNHRASRRRSACGADVPLPG
jgi:hypothetical protein